MLSCLLEPYLLAFVLLSQLSELACIVFRLILFGELLSFCVKFGFKCMFVVSDVFAFLSKVAVKISWMSRRAEVAVELMVDPIDSIGYACSALLRRFCFIPNDLFTFTAAFCRTRSNRLLNWSLLCCVGV